MQPETKTCQSCKKEFVIEPEDFVFYEKMKVPAPTWCPECRMIRRMAWRNEHAMYLRPDSRTGKTIFSMYSPDAQIKVWDYEEWKRDMTDPLQYGREIDWSTPFFTQLRSLMLEVPFPAKMVLNHVNSDYCNDCGEFKNCYMAFSGSKSENVCYSTNSSENKDSMELNETRESELVYDCFFCTKSYHVFYSSRIQDCTDIWFSRDLIGCNNCFACANLRNKSYCFFNEQLSRAEYKQKLQNFHSGSYSEIMKMKDSAKEFWQKCPVRYQESVRSTNVSGNYHRNSHNIKQSYYAIDSENISYSYRSTRSRDIMDITFWGGDSEMMYECIMCGRRHSNIKFCYCCAVECRNIEYCMECQNSQYCFGCVGLRGKQYCILNKQYTKEAFDELRLKIIKHMDEMPYTDQKGRVYKYGEFFPPEFSPLEYNESLAQEYYPLTEESAGEKGFRWYVRREKNYQPTIEWTALPDDIKDVNETITKEIISCAHEGTCHDQCTKAFRIIPQELELYKRLNLPLPRLCVNCRHYERLKLRNPIKLWHRKCMKAGCENEFETSYSPERPEIVYCESCYQAEVV